jgi:hypothetical protein
MQIADQVGAVFVDVAVEAEFEIGPAQLFDEIVVGDLLIAGRGVMPDRSPPGYRARRRGERRPGDYPPE